MPSESGFIEGDRCLFWSDHVACCLQALMAWRFTAPMDVSLCLPAQLLKLLPACPLLPCCCQISPSSILVCLLGACCCSGV